MWRRSSPSEPRPGDAVGPYRIEQLLGEGGMGRVYRAVRADGQPVALKLVRGDFAGDDVYRRRFEREAHAATKVRHEHVVAVVDSGEHEGVPWIAQRYVGGGSLADRLDSGPLELRTAVRVCTAVADGLDALHAEGIVHRDVKPGNILLDERGEALITDFGLAKHLGASVLTKEGQAVGSMDYMAPEQIRGADVSGRTDVYALGCVLYECIAGSPPFAHREGMGILWGHLQDAPADPAASRPDVPTDVSWAILTALEKEPERRPPTAIAYANMVRVAAHASAG
jgi:serine/threonine protein kinase